MDRSGGNGTRQGSESDWNVRVHPSAPKPCQSAQANYRLYDCFLKSSSRKIPSLPIIVIRTK